MKWIPYHHDWKLLYSGEYKWRIHWFGRYGGYPEWKDDLSRLAPDMICFMFVERNTCWVRVNGTRISLKAGDLLVMSGADEFIAGHNPAKPVVNLSVSLAVSQGSMVNMLLQRKFNRCYTLPDPAGYVRKFESVLAAMSDTSPFRDLQIGGALAGWLAYLLTVLDPPLQKNDNDRSAVDRILAAQTWALDRISTVITLSEWSSSVRLSPVYFGSLFKRETGMSPMEWLNERRLEMAAQYLAGTNKSVAEIAADCGYSCQFYFSRQFRLHHGLPPLRYRKTSIERTVGTGSCRAKKTAHRKKRTCRRRDH